jgi:phosphoglycerate kinase
MVFTFYKARGLGVGSSLVEEDQLELAKKLEKIAKEKGVKVRQGQGHHDGGDYVMGIA